MAFGARIAQLAVSGKNIEMANKMPKLKPEQVPNHVAVVMDGNGRWAKKRGLARTKGHEAG